MGHLEECSPPFPRQWPRFLFFCPFKHASFGCSSPAVLSFLRQNVCAGGNLVDLMSWANRVENPCPDKPARRRKKYNKKTNTQPSTSLLAEARVVVAAPGRSKVSAPSEGIWEERKPGRRGEEVSHSDTPQLMLCACGWSLTGLRSGLYHYQ